MAEQRRQNDFGPVPDVLWDAALFEFEVERRQYPYPTDENSVKGSIESQGEILSG